MGATPSIPKDSLLGCVLANWENLDRVPQYKLGDQEVWPESGSLNYNTILQLDLFCKRKGKWGEVSSMQMFMTLFQN
ncbi:hypothetical protein DBR06_SOUSAS7610057, partial [Sousa chinensis]